MDTIITALYILLALYLLLFAFALLIPHDGPRSDRPIIRLAMLLGTATAAIDVLSCFLFQGTLAQVRMYLHRILTLFQFAGILTTALCVRIRNVGAMAVARDVHRLLLRGIWALMLGAVVFAALGAVVRTFVWPVRRSGRMSARFVGELVSPFEVVEEMMLADSVVDEIGTAVVASMEATSTWLATDLEKTNAASRAESLEIESSMPGSVADGSQMTNTIAAIEKVADLRSPGMVGVKRKGLQYCRECRQHHCCIMGKLNK